MQLNTRDRKREGWGGGGEGGRREKERAKETHNTAMKRTTGWVDNDMHWFYWRDS